MNGELKELAGKLESAFADRLVSVTLYGSAASGERDARSDLNVLCVLKEITPRELEESEPVLRWWREKGYPSPLLMSEEEVAESADSFPIEFRDMKQHRRVLSGLDVIADLHVDVRNHRVLVEHELRSKLLRLRQQGARVLSDPEKLLTLCVDSVSTFVVLGRHALMAAGIEPKTERRAVTHQLAKALEADMRPLERLIDIREDKAGPHPGDPGELFAQYLIAVQSLIEFVDGLDSSAKGGRA
jgi:predicted nucleotidyltransferase